MLPKFLKRMLGGADEQTVVIQEIIEGGAPLAGEVRTDPSMAAMPPIASMNGLNGLNGLNSLNSLNGANQTTADGAQPPAVIGEQLPATTGGTGPLDVLRDAARGVGKFAQSAGDKAVEFGKSPEGKELATSLASLFSTWVYRGAQLTDDERKTIATKMRDDFTDFISISDDVAKSMTPAERATTYSLMNAFNRLVPISDELRAASMPIGTGPLPVVPKKSSASNSDEDQVVRKLTEIPRHTPRTLAELAQQLVVTANWASEQLQGIQTDLGNERAQREVMMNDAKNRTQSLSKELLNRLKRLRKDISRERSWFDNLRGSFKQ